MVLFAKFETDPAYSPLTISPTLYSLTEAIKQKFPQLQTVKVRILKVFKIN
jgi:hypothetical protein